MIKQTRVKKAKIESISIYTKDGISAWPSVSITVKVGGFWTGTICYEDKETTDGRIIEDNALTWKKEPMSLLSIPDRAVVGVVNEITRREYGSIRANGTTDLPPGDYCCGIDLNIIDIEHVKEDDQ